MTEPHGQATQPSGGSGHTFLQGQRIAHTAALCPSCPLGCALRTRWAAGQQTNSNTVTATSPGGANTPGSAGLSAAAPAPTRGPPTSPGAPLGRPVPILPGLSQRDGQIPAQVLQQTLPSGPHSPWDRDTFLSLSLPFDFPWESAAAVGICVLEVKGMSSGSYKHVNITRTKNRGNIRAVSATRPFPWLTPGDRSPCAGGQR